MGETIRAVRREDVPAVAEMFSRIFMKSRAAPGALLPSYIEEIVLPRRGFANESEEPRSRVFIDANGAVRGFIGVWPRRMVLGARTIEAAAAGSLMVDRPEEHPTAGARLLRSFLAGPQELSFSETANELSQGMWQRVGGERLPTTSLDWMRVLRPSGFCVATAARAFRPAAVLRPVAAGLDRLIDAAGVKALQLGDSAGYTDVDASSAEIEAVIPQLSESYELRPDWQSPTLSVLLAHAQSKERYGDLRQRIVYSRRGEPVGCYLYYARRGDVARVLQLLARPGTAGPALNMLFRHAASVGCVGVRGRTDPVLFDALVAHRCLFYHGSAMVVHARDKSLLRDVRGARALLTGLAGESWNRLIGGSFA